MVKKSQALIDFKKNLKISISLLNREKRFQDPPLTKNRIIVQGLRGGAAILMVAVFENYLKELLDETLQKFTLHPKKFNPLKIPEIMIYSNIKGTLEISTKNFGDNSQRSDKIQKMKSGADLISKELINPDVFKEYVKSNPNAKKIDDLFKNLGIGNVFIQIKNDFDNKWGCVTHQTYIQDTLNTILDRRHRVAHTGDALNITRLELNESIRFLEILAHLLDEQVILHVKKIYKKK